MMEPINEQVEMQVLAGMMNNQGFMYEALSEAHEEMFTTNDRKQLFNKIVGESSKGKVTAKIIEQDSDHREKALIRTTDSAWIDADHSYKALHNLKDVYLKRQLYYTINDTLKRMDSETSDQLVAAIEQSISSFYFDDKNENIVDPEEYAKQALNEFYELMVDPDKAKGIPFSIHNEQGHYKGFPALDDVFNGAGGGDLILIAAETGHGKTALAVTLARLFSLYQDYAGYYENAEMKLREMLSRLLAPIAQVDAKEMLYARLEGTKQEIEGKKDRIDAAYQQYQKSKLYLSRIPNLPLHKAKGLARQVKNRYKQLDYLVVDYIGRMTMEGKRNMNSWDEFYEITKHLKELAMTLDIPIFVLAQLKSDGQLEGAKKMANECDGVLYFKPIDEKDKEYIEDHIHHDLHEKINYKIVKAKVRRDDNPAPIYVNFDKKRQFINEVRN